MGRWTVKCGNHETSVIISEHVAWEKLASGEVVPIFGYCYDDKIESEAHDENGNLKEDSGYFYEAIFISETNDAQNQDSFNSHSAAETSNSTIRLSVYTNDAEKIELEVRTIFSTIHTDVQIIHRTEWELRTATYSSPVNKYKEREEDDKFFNKEIGLTNDHSVEEILEKIGKRLGELDVVDELKEYFENNLLNLITDVGVSVGSSEGIKYYEHKANVRDGNYWRRYNNDLEKIKKKLKDKKIGRADAKNAIKKLTLEWEKTTNKAFREAKVLAQKAKIWKWGGRTTGAAFTIVFGAFEAQKHFRSGNYSRGWISMAVTAVGGGVALTGVGLPLAILIAVTTGILGDFVGETFFADVSDDDIVNLPPETFIGPSTQQPLRIVSPKSETPAPR